MDQRDAVELIADAVAESGSTWADVGAGSGTFTHALRSLLPPGRRIYAIDRNPNAIKKLHELGEDVIVIQADFADGIALPDELDGMLLANALHFVRDAEDVLKRLVRHVRGGGRVVIVEYDRRAANPWVPFPIRADRWPALAAAAGLVNARVIARRPSEYVGEFYVGLAETSRER